MSSGWTSSKRFKHSSSASSGASGSAAAARAPARGRFAAKGSRGMLRVWRNPAGSSYAWAGSPFGRSLRTEMTYTTSVALTAIGDPNTYLFSINSLYDPDVTGTGNQPRFFDTLCGANNGTAPFNAYRVYGSKIKVTLIPTGSDSTAMRGLLGIGLYPITATAPTTLAEMLARSDYKTKFVGYWAGGTDHATLTRKCVNSEFFDVKDLTSDPNKGALYNANPADTGRWGVSYAPYDGSSTRTCHLFVKIVYDCEFFARNDVADS